MKKYSVPYVHQVMDTPESFDGRDACGPTSAVMALAGYGSLTPYPIHVHTDHHERDSNFGYYVSQQYTNNGITFNHGQPDASNNTAYGAYGWCTQNQEAFAYLIVDYMAKNGIAASFHQGATEADVKAALDGGHLVVLSTLLTHEGHLVLAIGYTDDGKIIVNDPWGDATSAATYGQEPNGDGVTYTWDQFGGVPWVVRVDSVLAQQAPPPPPYIPAGVTDLSKNISPAVFTASRAPYPIILLVLHDTVGKPPEAPDSNTLMLNTAGFQNREQNTIDWLQGTSKAVSAHYLVGPEALGAKTYLLCPESAIAYHAGGTAGQTSSWTAPNGKVYDGRDAAGVSIVNHISIGIERWGAADENVGPQQTAAFVALATDIAKRYKLTPAQIMAHKDLKCGSIDGETLLATVRAAVTALK